MLKSFSDNRTIKETGFTGPSVFLLVNVRGPVYFAVSEMPSYQYRKSHCGDKTILRPSYLHNGISYNDKIASLYWIRAQNIERIRSILLLWCPGSWHRHRPSATRAQREREIKFICLFGNRGHRGPYSPYKPCNHNLYIRIIIFPHIDNPQSTGYN